MVASDYDGVELRAMGGVQIRSCSRGVARDVAVLAPGGEVVGAGNVAIFVDKTPENPEPTYSVSATGGGAKVIVVVEEL